MERRWMERENKIFIINDSTLHLYVWSHIDTFYVFLRLFTLGTNIGFCLFPYLTALGLHPCTQRLSLATVSGYSLDSVLGLLNAGASQCRGFSLWRMGSRQHRLSHVVHRLSCSAACGIFLDQGSNPCPLHCHADSHPGDHQGSPKYKLLKKKFKCKKNKSKCLSCT